MIKSIKLTNFLSFGSEKNEVELRPLNIIIGTNGSGKSNFLEAFDLLQYLPSNIGIPIREGGGFSDWLYKGTRNTPNATLDVIIDKSFYAKRPDDVRYTISFSSVGQGYEIIEEQLVNYKEPRFKEISPYIYYEFKNGRPIVNIQNPDPNSSSQYRTLHREDIDITQSILAQKRDVIHYPEITYLAQGFSKIRMYREWQFGRYTPPRLRQKADSSNQYLEPDCSNLGMVLNQIDMNPLAKNRLLKELQCFYKEVEDYGVNISNNTVQIYFHEHGLLSSIPATRLSDGTLRYLCLLAILCNPYLPPLICIDEPELGLHPDVLPNLGKLLREVSERCQLIITTHSEAFVDLFTDNPEAILVAEKTENGTQLTRLDKEQLQPWLEKYKLGNLWTRGDLGGTRW
jgi:predicted ATPase